MQLISADFRIGENSDGVFIKRFQDIPQEFLDRCRATRDGSNNDLAGEYHEVASIPQAVVDQWLKEGFDVFNEPVRASVARLKAQGLDYFITTKKRV